MVGGDHQRRQVVDFWRCTAFVLSYSLTATRNHINDFFSGGSISGWEKLFLFVGDGFDIMVAGFYVCTSLETPAAGDFLGQEFWISLLDRKMGLAQFLGSLLILFYEALSLIN